TAAEIDLSEYQSVVDIFTNSVTRYRDRVAFSNMGTTMTYGELEQATRNFAAWLQHQGLQRGDRIALMMPNVLQYPVALLGAMRAGLVVVNTNPMYTARELRHQLLDSGARAIVVVENVAHVLEEVRDSVPIEFIITTEVGDLLDFPKRLLVNLALKHVKKAVPPWKLPGSVTFREVLDKGAKLPLQEVLLGFEDIAFLQYTGGTTGVAKGAMLTHKNMVSNMLQSREWLAPSGIAPTPATKGRLPLSRSHGP
ncbi:MAG: long-chain-fatty-acid--CoA ligase, partial [Gemmatimonadetes bacterium HGW-Gemmatimonadetes-1]